MTGRLAVLTVLLLGLVLACPSQSAQAQIGPGYVGQLFGYGYSANNLDYIPYFAAHPPVYYSRPVPRTYGYSPYAYPAGTMTPDVRWVAPEVVLNPFYDSRPVVTPAETPHQPASTGKVATRPLRLENPFYRVSHTADAR